MAVWGASIWLASNGGLYLVVDANGNKYCVDGLSRYFGFPQRSRRLLFLAQQAFCSLFQFPFCSPLGQPFIFGFAAASRQKGNSVPTPIAAFVQRPNPSVKGTATSGLRPLVAAPYVER
jgi:hypothetical protein